MITMLSVLALAKIMGYSGIIGAIAAFLVGSLGTLYPLVSPLIGALGTFVTGSGTSLVMYRSKLLRLLVLVLTG